MQRFSGAETSTSTAFLHRRREAARLRAMPKQIVNPCVSSQMTRKLILERDGAIARIVLNQPEAMNAIGPEMARELARAAAEFGRDDAVRCVIVTGAGAHFMAGGGHPLLPAVVWRP